MQSVSTGKQTFTGAGAVVTLTTDPATIPAGTTKAWVQAVGSGNIRYWLSGATPSAGEGQLIVGNDPPLPIDGYPILTAAKFYVPVGVDLVVIYFGVQ
jgi:hypothetical protein